MASKLNQIAVRNVLLCRRQWRRRRQWQRWFCLCVDPYNTVRRFYDKMQTAYRITEQEYRVFLVHCSCRIFNQYVCVLCAMWLVHADVLCVWHEKPNRKEKEKTRRKFHAKTFPLDLIYRFGVGDVYFLHSFLAQICVQPQSIFARLNVSVASLFVL